MNNKTLIIIILIFNLSSLFSGCLEDNNQEEKQFSPLNNSAPVCVINGAKTSFFGEAIEFNASESYDPDGTIELYFWDFGDNNTIEGVVVTHTYDFEDIIEIREFPIIYSVLLRIVDNNGSWEYLSHNISLYPDEYIFYFNDGGLTNEKPSFSNNLVKSSSSNYKFHQNHIITYELPSYIDIESCNWKTSILIVKPKFKIINKITILLQNQSGNNIAEEEIKFKLFDFWEEKIITLNGKIDKTEEFKSIKFIIKCFSINEKISIIHGGDNPSHISFYFMV